MTSLPISSKTKTFHAASSPDGAEGSAAASSWASMSVMGALRLRMRLMLARGSSQPFSTRRQRRAYLFACLVASWPWWGRLGCKLDGTRPAVATACAGEKTQWLVCLVVEVRSRGYYFCGRRHAPCHTPNYLPTHAPSCLPQVRAAPPGPSATDAWQAAGAENSDTPWPAASALQLSSPTTQHNTTPLPTSPFRPF